MKRFKLGRRIHREQVVADRDTAFPALEDQPAGKVQALPDAIRKRHRMTESAAVHFLIWVGRCHDGVSQPRRRPRGKSRGRA